MYILVHAIVEEGKESLWVSIYILVHAIVEEGKESL